jgi:hypothetical protein
MSGWIMAQRSVPKDGERANGDAVVLRKEGDRALVAVIDGLGHGEAAALAAGRAADYLMAMALTDTLESAMQGMHEAPARDSWRGGDGVSAARLAGRVLRGRERRDPLLRRQAADLAQPWRARGAGAEVSHVPGRADGRQPLDPV